MSGCKKMLQAMKERPYITGMDCFEMGVMNYKGRIYDLRCAGYNIKTHMVSDRNSDGDPIRYAQYSLVKS